MYVWVARMAKAVTNGKRYRNPHDICEKKTHEGKALFIKLWIRNVTNVVGYASEEGA